MTRKARNFKGFFRPKLGDLQKRSSPKLRLLSRPISQIQTFEGGCFRMGGGGYFPFFTENRPQKHKKHAILRTSQANGGARAPPPLATLLVTTIRNLAIELIDATHRAAGEETPLRKTENIHVASG